MSNSIKNASQLNAIEGRSSVQEKKPLAKLRVRDFIAQSVIIVAMVLGTLWMLDLMIDFEGEERWMLFIIVPFSTVAGLILAAVITGITFFSQDEI